jgi:hypothetical protein
VAKRKETIQELTPQEERKLMQLERREAEIKRQQERRGKREDKRRQSY